MTLVNDRGTFGIPNLAVPGSARRSPGTETQLVTDRLAHGPPPQIRKRLGCDRLRNEWPDAPNSVSSYVRLSPRTEEFDSHRSQEAELIDTVDHLQLEIEALTFEQSAPPVLAMTGGIYIHQSA